MITVVSNEALHAQYLKDMEFFGEVQITKTANGQFMRFAYLKDVMDLFYEVVDGVMKRVHIIMGQIATVLMTTL